MKEITIKHLAYMLKQAKDTNQPRPIFFLGAGASKSGNIPLASEITTTILEKYGDNPFINDLPEKERTYAKLMDCLHPNLRDQLLKQYIANAKINVTHIYLAQLLKEGYVDYVLTVNFDNLMLRALALFNIFPPTYDMAILKDLTTSCFVEQSVVYLHGQNHGLWLLNTPEELKKVSDTLPRVFDSIKNKRPWIFIGYSGEDQVFEHIKKLGRFDNGLYWIAYKNNEPIDVVRNFLNMPNTNASIIKSYDSDSFIIKLTSELGLKQPDIVDKPFSALQQMLENIVDIEDTENYAIVKERLSIAHRQVAEAVKYYEFGEKESKGFENIAEIESLKKEIINIIVSDTYDVDKILDVEQRVNKYDDNELCIQLANLYYNWGTSMAINATESNNEKYEQLFTESFGKFEKAIELKPDFIEAYYNWGTGLGFFADLKSNCEAEKLYEQAIDKYQNVLRIDPSNTKVLINLGNDLTSLARTKNNEEAERLFLKAIDNFQTLVTLQPDNFNAYFGLGDALIGLGDIKKPVEAEREYKLAIEKYKTGLKINSDNSEVYINWGRCLGYIAGNKGNDEAEILYNEAIEKFQNALKINPSNSKAYTNWGICLGNIAILKAESDTEILFETAFEKYQKSIELNPNNYDAYFSWGSDLRNLIMKKKDTNKSDLYEQVFDKYQKAIELNPNDYRALINWGICLTDLAKIKTGNVAEELYLQSLEKYDRVIELNSDCFDLFKNRGNTLWNFAQIKDAENLYELSFSNYEKAIQLEPKDDEVYYILGSRLREYAERDNNKFKKQLYLRALENLKKAFDLGNKSYNLACLYAAMNDKVHALEYLVHSLVNEEIKVAYIEKDKDWMAFRDDDDFKALIEKYKNKE